MTMHYNTKNETISSDRPIVKFKVSDVYMVSRGVESVAVCWVMEAPKAGEAVSVENSKVAYMSMVSKRPVSYFETWANWRTL